MNGAAKAKDKTGGELSRDKLTDMLLAIVEEKTGYPRDMVGLDQSLESDLGIDSIKRIEVVGAMLQALPERYREALSASRSKLNTQATLEGMLEHAERGREQREPRRSLLKSPGREHRLRRASRPGMSSLPKPKRIAAAALRRITPGPLPRHRRRGSAWRRRSRRR